jgi:hypothetical protein
MENGTVVICDFFRRDDATGQSRLGGGHSLGRFYEEMEKAGFSPVIDSDITSRTAPNMDIVSDMMSDLAQPLWELLCYYLENNYPRVNRFARWRYKKKIAKIEKKYFSGSRNAKSFAADKSYRLILCKLEVDNS